MPFKATELTPKVLGVSENNSAEKGTESRRAIAWADLLQSCHLYLTNHNRSVSFWINFFFTMKECRQKAEISCGYCLVVWLSVSKRISLDATICHQYFLITISFPRYTPVSNWSNRPLLLGGDSSCSWVFYSCTGPKGESLHCRRGVSWSPLVSVMQSFTLSTLQSTPMKGHKQAAFHVRFIEKLVLEVGVVSQQYNGTQHTSPDTAL